VTLAVKENGWDGNDDTEEAAQQWSFAGALLYALTIITTIGTTAPPSRLLFNDKMRFRFVHSIAEWRIIEHNDIVEYFTRYLMSINF